MKLHHSLLIFVVILAGILRFFLLGQIPPSLDWDEASLGWNAYSILETGSDEYGSVLPLSIRSFNDFKPPLYVYSLVPVLRVLGTSDWSVRFPSALAGTLSVWLTFMLVNELTKKRKLAVLSAFLLAISPWAVNFSRVAFEANLALFWFLAGAVTLVYFLHRQNPLYLIFTVVFFLLSMYSYHSARLFVPLFSFFIFIFYFSTFKKQFVVTFLAVSLAAVLLVPLGISLYHQTTTGSRFSQVGIFSASGANDKAKRFVDLEKEYRTSDLKEANPSSIFHNRYLNFSKVFASNYLDHFNFDFLFLKGDSNPRHHAPDTGMLLLVSAPFMIIGAILLLKDRPRYFLFLLAWLISAPVASSLTSETPHAVRSLTMLPIPQVLTATGVLYLAKFLKRSKVIFAVIAILYFCNFYYFSDQYFVQMPVENASSWQYGYKQLVTRLNALKGQKMVTLAYDQPYIYFLFYGDKNPLIKNPGTFSENLDEIRFVNWKQMSDEEKYSLPADILQVASPNDMYTIRNVTEVIKYPDGKIAFYIGHN